jgi:ABC-type multidrug transport system fused ATPase/permease subunit
MKFARNAKDSISIVFKCAPLFTFLYVASVIFTAVIAPLQAVILEKLIDSVKYAADSGYQTTFGYGVLLIASVVLSSLLAVLSTFIMTRLTAIVSRHCIKQTLHKFSRIRYDCLENVEYQNIIQRIAEAPQTNVIEVFTVCITIIGSAVTLLGILAVFFRISLGVALTAAALTVPIIILEVVSANREMKLRWGMTTDVRKRYYVQQLFVDRHALQEIKLFRAKKLFLDISARLTGIINEASQKAINAVLSASAASNGLMVVFLAFLIAALSVLLSRDRVTLGVFIALVGVVQTFFATLRSAVSVATTYTRINVNVEYYTEFMKLPERTAPTAAGDISNIGEIRFENVSFSYPGRSEFALSDVSFTIRRGEHIAFVGENGAGKTTVIKLILGLYQPTGGKIFFDGIDGALIADEERGRIISAIFQDYCSYFTTLRENVAFGDIGKIDDDDGIYDALDKAGLKSFTEKHGYSLDQNLGRFEDDGVDVSGGEWQKLALSRLFLSDAPFLILDEPTASLDPISESELYGMFGRLFSHRATIVVSHRLASAKMSDKIFVIDAGRITERGNHDELMLAGSKYSDMYTQQSEWYKES